MAALAAEVPTASTATTTATIVAALTVFGIMRPAAA
jgi:hypothetical protein